ncbi:MAG: polyphosphate kinase 1, partial [Gemmatimonadales bacterium]|nr:polyphosphate kinase 1 [Gemmatimonadales bacterium]
PGPKHSSEHYLNRQLSWLEFNARVLEEARDPTNPLLERLKFLSIFSSNLDEFFEVRVAGLQEQVYAGMAPQDFGADGLGPAEQLAAIVPRVHALVAEQHRILREDVMPGLREAGIALVRYPDLAPDERARVDELFRANIYPVLTPLAIDPGHPFPHVHNKSLNLALLISPADDPDEPVPAVGQVPAVLDRIVPIERCPGVFRFMLLEDLVLQHAQELFGGFRVVDATVFRVTRNTDLSLQEEEAGDLLEMIEESLRQRLRSDPVRLEIAADAGDSLFDMLTDALDLESRDVYRVDGPLDLTVMMGLSRLDGFRGLRDEPLIPRVPPAFAQGRDVFEVIRQQDVLVHHPFESFGAVIDLIERAADDPNVLAIKQTLYRTGAPSAIISALGRAAQNGKQVTALVELKARFDEQNNILWARELEEAGVHVVYGVVGLKTHCKASLVVRREPDGIRRYVHLSTGNYNAVTARTYTDLGLFTCDADFGEDATTLFNLLTGYSRGDVWKSLVVAPVSLRERVVDLIERERRNAEEGRPARIIVKMNALVEPSVVDALYEASQAGVSVDLLIRGICCLRPGLPGVSEGIRVSSIVDKFLEHTRIFYFENDGDPEIFLSSADWMPRNFFRRIEVMFPVRDPRLKARIITEILETLLADNVKSRILECDGSYDRRRPLPGEEPVRSQLVLQGLARQAAQQSAEHVAPFQPILHRSRVGADRTGAGI